MQQAIQDSLGLKPVEQDVIVLYEGEKEQYEDNFWKVLIYIIYYILYMLKRNSIK